MKLWNIKTIDGNYWKLGIDEKSCGQHNIDFGTPYDKQIYG
jgi:hypothetical protein